MRFALGEMAVKMSCSQNYAFWKKMERGRCCLGVVMTGIFLRRRDDTCLNGQWQFILAGIAVIVKDVLLFRIKNSSMLEYQPIPPGARWSSYDVGRPSKNKKGTQMSSCLMHFNQFKMCYYEQKSNESALARAAARVVLPLEKRTESFDSMERFHQATFWWQRPCVLSWCVERGRRFAHH